MERPKIESVWTGREVLQTHIEALEEYCDYLESRPAWRIIGELEELLKLTGGKCKRYLPKEVKERLQRALND